MVPVVDLDMSVSGRVILEPHQVEMEHRGKMRKTTPFFAWWRREERRENEGARRRREEGGRESWEEEGGEKQ